MEYQLNGLNGAGISFSNSSLSVNSSIDPTTISATDNNNYSPSSISTVQNHYHRNNSHHSNGTTKNNEDPMHSWWESVSKARAHIHCLISILFPDHIHHRNSISSHDIDGDNFENDVSSLKSTLSSLADCDRPAQSLLDSFDAYSAISSSLSAPHSGSGDDTLCQWLYDTFQSSDPDLRLVVLSFVPLVAGLYLSRVHSFSPVDVDTLTPSLAGFEAVLLALYVSETKSRGGKPVVVSIPDLSQPSLYHIPSPNGSHRTMNAPQFPSVGVVSPPLEPQVAVKSTKRGCIIGVAFDSYYKHISSMPSWSKIELCRFATAWAGANCSCSDSLDHPNLARCEFYGDEYIEDDDEDSCFLDTNGVTAVENNVRIPLPWELLQPILRILGHCLLGHLNSRDIKDAARVAVRRLYARALHDLFPQSILATRSLIQLDNRARVTAETDAIANASSTANAPNDKSKKPKVLLVSK